MPEPLDRRAGEALRPDDAVGGSLVHAVEPAAQRLDGSFDAIETMLEAPADVVAKRVQTVRSPRVAAVDAVEDAGEGSGFRK